MLSSYIRGEALSEMVDFGMGTSAYYRNIAAKSKSGKVYFYLESLTAAY